MAMIDTRDIDRLMAERWNEQGIEALSTTAKIHNKHRVSSL
jgi:hypothetical protein